jgi:tetratricopeptide (TPR) repeat protein
LDEIVATGPEAVFQALLYLRERGEATPRMVAARVRELYRAVNEDESSLPADLRVFFLSEAARVLAGVLRGIGRPSELTEWLDISEAHARLDVNPEPQLARIEMVRLLLCHEQSLHSRICRIAPRLERKFADLGMDEERVKCRIAWAAALKVLGRFEQALQVLDPVKKSRNQIRPSLYGWVLLHSGDLYQLCGDYGRALEELIEAGRLLLEGRQFTGLADVKSMISGIYRAHGRLEEAIELLKSSEQQHALLGMRSGVAYHRILIAETYLAMGRPREAEIEIRAALPIIEEQGMLADAVIAVNLLREAVRQRKLDPADNRESFKPKT